MIKSVIVIKITDGLGNQMFQYVYAKSLQMKLSQRVYLDISDINNLRSNNQQTVEWTKLCDKRQYQLDRFYVSLPIVDEKRALEMDRKRDSKYKLLKYCDQLRLLPTVRLKESECREERFRYRKYQNYYVEGYFFDKSYSDSIENTLRREFKLRDKIAIPKNLEQILKRKNTVSIHIRRGDFLKVGRDISNNDYYDRAIEYIQKRMRDLVFLIFSDDIEWVKKNRKFKQEHVFISDNCFSDSEELILMSMCSNNIVANSTFSYWGAWLNDNKEKTVIVPRGWRQKIIPESWIAL